MVQLKPTFRKTRMPPPRRFILPDLLASCPLIGSTNPHYKKAGAESKAWINKYNVFTDRKRAFFVQGSNERLVSHTYPYAGYSQFRTCCDFVNLLFVLDEVSDDQTGKDARRTGETLLRVLHDPDWTDHSVLAKIVKDFRTRFVPNAGPRTLRRFLNHCARYVDAISKEAQLRERGEVLDLSSFIHLRRENSAVRLCFGLFEYVLGIDLPDEVFQDSCFMSLYWAACDCVCWANDVYSYNMEQAKGHRGNNIVTVLMKEYGYTLQEAADFVGLHFKKLMNRFLIDKTRLPSWGPPVDAAVASYVAALEHWIRGNLDWSFETQRYFGAEHLEVKRTRIVILRPPGDPEDHI